MKKLQLLMLILLVVGGTAFADHPKNGLGVGAVVGGGLRDGDLGGDIGLSLRVPSVPIYWGIRLAVENSDVNLGLTGDYYFIDENLIKEKGLKLDWFLGLGAYGSFGFYDDTYIALGARMPIGLSWHFAKAFELWGALAPSLGLQVSPDFVFPEFWVAAEIGLRAWLK